MAFIAVYDACVLFPAPLRDFLLRLANTGLFRARWTDLILDECFRNVAAKRGAKPEALARTRTLMNLAVEDALVTNYEPLIDGLTLPDAGDRHVLAAAIRCGAQVIVTSNLDDFPTDALARYDIEAQHPDEFAIHLIDLDPGAVARVVQEQAADLRRPPRSARDLLTTLAEQGLVRTAAALRTLVP
jgi:hypothetical protein